ncbi:hypothetical protein [Kibdelosporangium phytohabitans]|nr:hypothetical protein [Kibdelosporangium phytohabitans]MBE1461447.1 hypothetical protein [Kibdelosporangium phytohabitans]
MNKLSSAELGRLAIAVEQVARVDARPGGPENVAAACVLLRQLAAEYPDTPIGEAAATIAGRLKLTVDHELRDALLR